MTLVVHNRVPRDDLALGLVRVEGVVVEAAPAALAEALDGAVARRRDGGLSPEEDLRRKAARDMLRNGRYKPTGRGKPASEYLLREAGGEGFPRINGPVDANNLVSLNHLLPISVWDLDLALEVAGGTEHEVRLGQEGERYVFNEAGQVLELCDLVCGCVLGTVGSTPLVTPIKDGLATKLRPSSTRLAGLIYYPLSGGSVDHMQEATREFLGWLARCGPAAEGAWAVAMPGETVTL